MSEIKNTIEDIKKEIATSPKEKILCVATTADLNNPLFTRGSTKETDTTISCYVILRDASTLAELVEAFDGVVDYFFLDSEIKNEFKDLERLFLSKIKKSKTFIFKPNDFTVESLDVFVSLFFQSLLDKKVLVLGAGNIGSKISLKLSERGAKVFLYGKDKEKTEKIVEGLNLIKRGTYQITEGDIESGYDLVLACTPGIAVVDQKIVEKMAPNGKIIDVGNRTILPEALQKAGEIGIEVLSLSNIGGYRGMIENWLYQRDFVEKKRKISLGSVSLILRGVLGKKGDILVDDVENPQKVFGVCDGIGGLLSKDEGREIVKNFLPAILF